MSILLEQGIFGIVTGIITTAVLFVIKTVWVSRIVPFWIASRYQGVLIDGQWNGADKNEDKDKGDVFELEAVLNLSQNAHHLNGSFFIQYKGESQNYALEFKVDGYMWEGYVTLNLTPKDRRVTSYATTLLKLHEGGTSLTGSWLFRNVFQERVDQVPLTLYRKG